MSELELLNKKNDPKEIVITIKPIDEVEKCCYICFERDNLKIQTCQCKAAVHEECFKKLLDKEKCTICNQKFEKKDWILNHLNESSNLSVSSNQAQIQNLRNRYAFSCSCSCSTQVCCVVLCLSLIVGLVSIVLGGFIYEVIHKPEDDEQFNILLCLLYGLAPFVGIILLILCICCICSIPRNTRRIFAS